MATEWTSHERMVRDTTAFFVHDSNIDDDVDVRGRLRREELHRRGSIMLSRQRSSLLSLEDRGEGELSRYLEEQGWEGEWDAAVQAVIATLQARRRAGVERPRDELLSPRKVRGGWQSPRRVRQPETAPRLPGLDAPAKDLTKFRPEDEPAAAAPRVDAWVSLSSRGPQSPRLSPQPPSISTPRWPTSPAARRSAIALPSPRTAAESARMSAEMEQNPFAKLHETRKKVREWRRESVRIAADSAIDHDEFAAQVFKSMAGSKLMIARVGSTSNQHDNSSTSALEGSPAAGRIREPRASAAAGLASTARGASTARMARASLEGSPRSRAHPLISARLYAGSAVRSPRETTSKWPDLVSRAGCLEDKLNLLGNLVALEALQGGGALSAYSGGRCGGSVVDAPGEAGSDSEFEGAGSGGPYDPCTGETDNTASHSHRRVRMALPAPQHLCDGGSDTGEPACVDGSADERGGGGLFAVARGASGQPRRGRERRGGMLPGLVPDKTDGIATPQLTDAAPPGVTGPGLDDAETPPSDTEPSSRGAPAASSDAGSHSPTRNTGMPRANRDAAVPAPSIMAMMKATSLLRRKAKIAAESVAARKEAAQAVKRREVLRLYDAYLSEEKGKAIARLRGVATTSLTPRPGLGAVAGNSTARSMDDKMKAAMQLVSGFESVLRLYNPGASRADIKEWCAWCTAPKPSATSTGAERRHQLSEVQRAEVAQLFASYDTDGSGALSLSELQSAFKDSPIAPEEFKRIFENIDEDQSGLLELSEFEMLVYQLKIF